MTDVEQPIAFLDSLVEETPLAIVVLDEAGRVTFCNRAFEALFLYSRSEILGRDLDGLIAPDDAAARGNTTRALEGETVHETARRLRKDGSAVEVELHAAALHAGSRIAGAFALYQDVTERHRSERALRESEEEQRQSQKMEAVGRLAGGIAHDFNNLLTVILGHCSMLTRRVPQESPMLGSIGEIRRAAEQAGLMTRRLLAFGHKQPLKPEVLDMGRVLKGLERMLRRLIRADIDLVINLCSDAGRVRADPGQLEQVVLNLVINAGDAMPGGGTLTLETSNVDGEDAEAAEVRGDSRPPWVKLTVRDTGIGMDSETLSRLFEPFFTTKKKGKGTGLGLSTVYGIVKQSGGSISVDSQPGRGTRFRVFLPQVEPQPEAVFDSEGRELPRGSETVLVVEDEISVRRLTVDVLEIHGYQVLEAENGLQGLEIVSRAREEIDLIVTDVVMPGMSGPDMIDRVALINPRIKVIFMTGYDDGILAREDAAIDRQRVQKPYSMPDLLNTVRDVLDEPG